LFSILLCLFLCAGSVLVWGWPVNVVGNRSLSRFLCWFWVVLSLLLGIAVYEWFSVSLGLVFQCCWESQFTHDLVLVSG
jgi:hypothetical protein